MKLVAATNNSKKLEELRRILGRVGHEVLSLADVGIDLEQPETGETFAENALAKAQSVRNASGLPALGDDSGLCVDALGGDPGVHSARFAGNHGDDEANNAKLMRLIERFPYAKRTAQFVCALALVMPNNAVLQVEGVCEGHIGFAPSGANGFGYDPLFYIGQKSFADMTDEEKDEISHRALALKRMIEELPDFVKKNGQPGDAAPAPAAPAESGVADGQ